MSAILMDPGMLRTRLVLEQVSAVPDGEGGHSEEWSVVAEVFSLLQPLAAKTRFGADQSLETVTHRIVVRTRADLESGMRFRKGNRLFAIVTVHDPDETGRYLICAAKETGR